MIKEIMNAIQKSEKKNNNLQVRNRLSQRQQFPYGWKELV